MGTIPQCLADPRKCMCVCLELGGGTWPQVIQTPPSPPPFARESQAVNKVDRLGLQTDPVVRPHERIDSQTVTNSSGTSDESEDDLICQDPPSHQLVAFIAVSIVSTERCKTIYNENSPVSSVLLLAGSPVREEPFEYKHSREANKARWLASCRSHP